MLYAGRNDVKQKTQIDMKRIALTFLTIFFMLETVFYTLIGLLSGIVVDLSYSFIDPRIRMGSRK